MATTKSGFLKFTTGGTTLLLAVPASQISVVQPALSATRVDLATVNAGADSYAKHGAVRLTLSGTTVQSPDLTNLAAIGVYAGDTAFASVSQIKFLNDGTQSLTIAPGASNQLGLPFTSLTLAAGNEFTFTFSTALTVTSTTKAIDVTPTAGGSVVINVGGA